MCSDGIVAYHDQCFYTKDLQCTSNLYPYLLFTNQALKDIIPLPPHLVQPDLQLPNLLPRSLPISRQTRKLSNLPLHALNPFPQLIQRFLLLQHFANRFRRANVLRPRRHCARLVRLQRRQFVFVFADLGAQVLCLTSLFGSLALEVRRSGESGVGLQIIELSA
jgi:hypothetical protein